MTASLLNTIIVIVIILIIWFVLRLLFRKLIEPHKSFIYSPGLASESTKLGYLAAEKRSSGFESVLVDEKKLNNKDVAEIIVVEDQNKVEFRNILLIDNSGSTAAEMDDYKKALKSFISTPFSGEKNSIYTFSDTLKKRCDFTDSQLALISAIEEIQPEGLTAMNDALVAAADLIASQELLEQKDGKSIFYNIILFTDGLDNVSNLDSQDVIKRLVGKTLFAVCTKEADLNLMYELAKNPRNVFIIGGTSAQSNLQNGASASLEEALLKIRHEKLKGRGTAAYVQMKDEDNQNKIRGFVNVLGEIYSCGSQGEGAFFNGLCENPGSEESKVFIGNYIVASRTNEDYYVECKGPFGNMKQSLPITPTAISAGAWLIYQLNKKEETKSKPESVLNAFPKTSLFSLILWCPVFLLYWFLKYSFELNIYGWLVNEFDITITQILLFFMLWLFVSSLYVDTLRRKKGFMLFNDAINNIVGTASLSKLIITLCVIGSFLSVLVFYPFSYSAFFICTLIAFSANIVLNYNGGKIWFINTKDPVYIPSFNSDKNGTKLILEFDYETSQGLSDSLCLEIRANSYDTKFETVQAAVLDPQSKNIIDYLENCVQVTSIMKNYNPLSESMMLAALGSIKSTPITSGITDYKGASKILLQKDISLSDKLIFTLSLFKEAAHELIYSEDMKSFAYRTLNAKEDSPFIFEYEQQNFYYFCYNEKNNAFQLAEQDTTSRINWIKI